MRRGVIRGTQAYCYLTLAAIQLMAAPMVAEFCNARVGVVDLQEIRPDPPKLCFLQTTREGIHDWHDLLMRRAFTFKTL